MKYERLTVHSTKGLKLRKGKKFVELLSDKNLTLSVLNRLAELEDKLERRQFVEPPCKIGDTVYRWLYGTYDEWTVTKINLYITDNEVDYCLCVKHETCGEDYFHKAGEGVEWFLTQEKAEAKLKELQKGN